MSNGLPTIIETRAEYDVEYDNNSKKMEELFNTIFPDVQVPCQYIYEVLKFLEETHVNAGVLPKVIRGVNNILLGTGNGQVIVHVQKNIMNVSVRENDENIKSKE
jgi:hypothetical protein